MGLAPLLYERSSQAQFLKPTVITLVYGLGFGMILVLLVVPALMAMQMDVQRQIAAAKRALGRPARAGHAGWVSVVATGIGAALFAVLVLPHAILGTALPFVAAQLPIAAGGITAAIGTVPRDLCNRVVCDVCDRRCAECASRQQTQRGVT